MMLRSYTHCALICCALQIEVNLAVLWEGPRNDRQQAIVRLEVVEAAGKILDQVQLWAEADQLRM
jgi:hypothetical protein